MELEGKELERGLMVVEIRESMIERVEIEIIGKGIFLFIFRN